MFDFLCGPSSRIENAYANPYQPPKLEPTVTLDVAKEIERINKILDALCRVYAHEYKDDVSKRPFAERYWQPDQPIIDRAKVMELEATLRSTQFELDQLQRKRG